MKNIIYIFIAIVIVCHIACEKGNLPNTFQQGSRTAASTYSLIQNSDAKLLVPYHYDLDREVYILKGNFNAQSMEVIQVNGILTYEDRIEVVKQDGSKLILSINPNILSAFIGNSLIQVAGSSNQEIFYSNGTPKQYPDISSVKCGCTQNGANSNCTNGGAGSSECSIEVNYGITGGHHIGQKCSVKCGSGYYSCCNK